MNSIQRKLLRKLKNLIVITILIYGVYSIYSIYSIIQQGPATSFQCYTGVLFGLCYLLPILVIEVIAYVIAKKSFSKNEGEEKNGKPQD